MASWSPDRLERAITIVLNGFAGACLFAASAASATAPPPPPPPVSDNPYFSLTVEFPGGRKLSTEIDDRKDCPTEKFCGGDYYGIGGDLLAGFHKLGLKVQEACIGPMGGRGCEITSIGDVGNSARGRWVMYRNGYRNSYPYNQIDRGMQPQHVIYRFISPSKRKS